MDHYTARVRRRRADFRANLERCRRMGARLEPWQLGELLGTGAYKAAELARELGFADVILEPGTWHRDWRKANGAAFDPGGFWTGR